MTPDRRDNCRLTCLLAAVVLAEIWLFLMHFGLANAPPTGDGLYYHQLAVNLRAGHGFSNHTAPPYEPTIWRTPGYPLFLTVTYSVVNSYAAVRATQFALLGLTAWLVYDLTSRLFGRRAALVAAMLCITYVPFIISATRLLTESVMTCWVALFSWLGLRSLQITGPNRWAALAFGVACGSGALVHPTFALLIVVPLWLHFRPSPVVSNRNRTLNTGAVALGFALCVAPWSARNIAVSHRFVPLSLCSGWSLYMSMQQYAGALGYHWTPNDWRVLFPDLQSRRAQAKELVDGLPAGDISRTVRWELLVDASFAADARRLYHRLTWKQILRSIPTRLSVLWNHGDEPVWAPRFHPLIVAQYALICLLALVGFWFHRRSLHDSWPLWIVPVYITLVHLVFHVESRYSLPARPFLFVYAGLGFASLWQLLTKTRRPHKSPPAAD